MENILFIDIETASSAPDFDQMDARMQALWEKKAGILSRSQSVSPDARTAYGERAAIFAEFGRIVCIVTGMLRTARPGEPSHESRVFSLRTYAHHDERALLDAFVKDLSLMDPAKYRMCAHNGKEFDYPYISRRLVIHQIPLPAMLQVSGKKPWEVAHLMDTMELWKFGDFKAYTSLDLLTAVLDIPSPKAEFDGSQVSRAFWQDHALSTIAEYCQRDVLSTAKVFAKLNYENWEPQLPVVYQQVT